MYVEKLFNTFLSYNSEYVCKMNKKLILYENRKQKSMFSITIVNKFVLKVRWINQGSFYCLNIKRILTTKSIKYKHTSYSSAKL